MLSQDINALYSMNISELRFLAFDTETTGVNTKEDEIVELAAVLFDEDFEQRSFESLVKPSILIPEEVVKVHGITNEMVKSAPPLVEVLNAFHNLIDTSGSNIVLVAHNAKFDLSFLHRQASKVIKKLQSYPSILVLDSCFLAKALLPNLKVHRLESLASFFKIKQKPVHRAMADAMTLKHIFMNLLTIAADRYAKPNRGLVLEDLIEISGGCFIYSPSNKEYVKNPFIYSPKISKIEECIGQETKIGIYYKSGGQEAEYRYITPLKISVRGMKVIIEALCHRDQIKKTFRADRIESIKIEY